MQSSYVRSGCKGLAISGRMGEATNDVSKSGSAKMWSHVPIATRQMRINYAAAIDRRGSWQFKAGDKGGEGCRHELRLTSGRCALDIDQQLLHVDWYSKKDVPLR
jgi:hypothetical protein